MLVVVLVWPFALGLALSRSLKICYAFSVVFGLFGLEAGVVMASTVEVRMTGPMGLSSLQLIMGLMSAFMPSWKELTVHFLLGCSKSLLALVSFVAFSEKRHRLHHPIRRKVLS